LTKIADGVEKAKGADTVQRLVSVVLNLMVQGKEYYCQFSQGNARPVLVFSAELMNGCTKQES
jgi:hypothetical protein